MAALQLGGERPSAERRAAEQRVRTALRDAVKASRLSRHTVNRKPAFSRGELLAWALKRFGPVVEQLAWYDPRLLPPIGGTSNQTLGGVVARGSAIIWRPDDLEWLRANYLAAQEEIAGLKVQLNFETSRANRAEAELGHLRQLDSESRAKSSRAGKKGGRPTK